MISKKISKISFGTWGISEWGKKNFKEHSDLCNKAYNFGITSFDTSPVYGDGYGEDILKSLPPEAYLFTKVHAPCKGLSLCDSYTLEWLLDIINKSRERLSRERIDVVQLHNWDFSWNDDYDLLDNRLNKIKELGLVESFGISLPKEQIPEEQLHKLIKYQIIDFFQIHYNLLQTENYSTIKKLIERGKKVFLRSSLLHGFISNPFKEFSENHPINKKYNDNSRKTLQDRLRVLIPTQSIDERIKIAIDNALKTGATSVIIGIRKENHLQILTPFLSY